MKVIGVRSCVCLFLIGVACVLQFSAALATGQPDAQQATIQGSRFPGIPLPGSDPAWHKRHRPVELTFTKWRTAGLPPPPAAPIRSLFKGFVGGDLGAGDLVAEVLDRKESTPCTALTPPCTPDVPVTRPIVALHAIYEFQVDGLSFTALIQGGTNVIQGRADGVTGEALLDGVILAGWRTGARVHVEFQTYPPLPAGPGCPDTRAPADRNCFLGTMNIERAPEK